MAKRRPIIRIKHPVLDAAIPDEAKPKAALYIRKKMTPAEYVNLMSGAYGHSGYDLSYDLPALKGHPLNNEKNNDRAVDRLLQHLAAEKNGKISDAAISQHSVNSLLEGIIENHPVSSSTIKDVIDNPEKYKLNRKEASSALAKQPSLNKEHLMQIAADPNMKFGDLVKHPAMDKEVAETLLNSKTSKLSEGQIDSMLKTMEHEDPSKQLLDKDDINKLIYKAPYSSIGTLEKLLDHANADPTKRKEIADDLLGIKGGSYSKELEDTENPDHFHWDNWSPGPNYSSSKAEAIAGSKHLTPEQIDHIKRHGDFDEKYALFNNANIDPKHSSEMYKNWLNDDVDKGYDLDHLKERIKKDHSFQDNYDDYYDDAQNEVQDDYPLSAYVRDNVDDSDLMGKDEEDWINDHLADSHEWTAPNPNHKDGGDEPAELDYSGRDMSDHPDYKKRYEEAQAEYDKELADRRRNPHDLPSKLMDRIYEGYDDYIRDDISTKAEEMYDDKMENAHENTDFLPGHLPELEQIKKEMREKEEARARAEAEAEEKKNNETLNQWIPNRSKEHPYGDLQHQVQMAQGYANANGGAIDVGTLNKMHPNMVQQWKAIFGGKGKLSSQDLEQKLQDIPKTPYAISHGVWDKGLQNINDRPQVVFRLDHTPESLAPLKADPNVHNTFNKIADVAQRSGHPTNANTIAWARVDANDPKHWMIDEVQSDFGSAARDYLDENGKKEEADAVDSIIKHHKNWREALINHVINEAKKHGVEKVSTHSPESKAAHTGADTVHTVYKDSYQKVPRAMGFKPVPMEMLPLTDEGKKDFMKGRSGTSTEDLIRMHTDAMKEHAHQHSIHSDLIEHPTDSALIPAHKELAEHHANMYKQHQKRLAQLDPSHRYRNVKTPQAFTIYPHHGDDGLVRLTTHGERNVAIENANNIFNKAGSAPIYGFDSALKEQPQVAGNPGHQFDLNPQVIKKSLEEVSDLMKVEKIDSEIKQKVAATLHLLQSNEDVLEQMRQSNPEAYLAVQHLIESMVGMAKKIGTDPETDMHKLQIQEQLDSAQNPEEEQQQGQEAQAPSGGGTGHLPSKDNPLHRRQTVYGPGAVRRYNSQDSRTKDASGEWKVPLKA